MSRYRRILAREAYFETCRRYDGIRMFSGTFTRQVFSFYASGLSFSV